MRVNSFFVVGGSPLLFGNKAFMAEPSDRLAIKDGAGEKKNYRSIEEEEMKRNKKGGKRGLNLWS